MFFIAMALVGCWYIAIYTDKILERAGIVYLKDQIIGVLLLLTVLEATRRSIGHVLMFIGNYHAFLLQIRLYFSGSILASRFSCKHDHKALYPY